MFPPMAPMSRSPPSWDTIPGAKLKNLYFVSFHVHFLKLKTFLAKEVEDNNNNIMIIFSFAHIIGLYSANTGRVYVPKAEVLPERQNIDQEQFMIKKESFLCHLRLAWSGQVEACHRLTFKGCLFHIFFFSSSLREVEIEF